MLVHNIIYSIYILFICIYFVRDIASPKTRARMLAFRRRPLQTLRAPFPKVPCRTRQILVQILSKMHRSKDRICACRYNQLLLSFERKRLSLDHNKFEWCYIPT